MYHLLFSCHLQLTPLGSRALMIENVQYKKDTAMSFNTAEKSQHTCQVQSDGVV